MLETHIRATHNMGQYMQMANCQASRERDSHFEPHGDISTTLLERTIISKFPCLTANMIFFPCDVV